MSHSHSHVAHVLLPLASSPPRYRSMRGCSVASFPIRRKRGTPSRKGSLDVFASSFLPSFLRLALFQTPSTSYYFSRFPLTLGRTSGISRVHSKRTHTGRRNEVPFIYFAVGTRARNKGRRLGFLPRFTSLRPGAFLSIGASVLTGTSRRRKQNRREERNRGPKFSVVRAVLCREFTRRGEGDDFLFTSHHRSSLRRPAAMSSFR